MEGSETSHGGVGEGAWGLELGEQRGGDRAEMEWSLGTGVGGLAEELCAGSWEGNLGAGARGGRSGVGGLGKDCGERESASTRG